jgi:peptidyl-prolyl cis-trans isomerase A (cyclophilin A)
MKIARSLLAVAAAGLSLALVNTTLAQTPGEKPKDPAPATQPATPAKPETKPVEKPAATPPAAATPTPAAATPGTEEKLVYVKMTTSKGDVVLELNNEKAPISTKNFLAYVDEKFYDGTIFHRVIDGFMVQGGGFTPDMNQKKVKDPIKNEWQNGLKNTKYTLAMARLGDGKPNEKTVNSATAQFFINVKDNSFLDQQQRDGGAYAVFGKVVAGTEVVDQIKAAKTSVKNAPNGQPFSDVPVETITINSMTRLTADEAKKLIDKK